MKDFISKLGKCSSPEDAKRLFDEASASVGHTNAVSNIRYAIGYFDADTRNRLYNLFYFIL